ncbi:MAG: hypothetical protein KIS92_22055 [Planctomycetota bacterium]|nr:hypothetical protein [Planctomycetota bacterium]
MSAWGAMVAKGIFALIGLLLVAVVVIVVNQRSADEARMKDRQAWDTVNDALKDAKSPQERIAALESVWSKVDQSTVHPNVMLNLAQWHYMMSLREERTLPERKKSLDRAKQVFDLLRQSEGKHPLYGALAAEGAAICREQGGDLDGAIEVLSDAVQLYESHFLHAKMCYELARAYWVRSLKTKADKDKSEALRWADKAVSESAGKEGDWTREAQFIKSLLEKNGPAWPNAEPPPPPAKKPDEAKKDEAKTGEAKKDEVKTGEAKKDEVKTGEAQKVEPKTEPEK